MPIEIATIEIGNPGNSADLNGFGRVDSRFAIGTYEVTNEQYSQFLNAVASGGDPYQLYNPGLMTSALNAGITRVQNNGTYHYSPVAGTEKFPVTGISWFDAARFANWLSNGQPTGTNTASTTEQGAYNLNGKISGLTVSRNSINPNTGQAPTFALPNEDEWYKAAYYDPTLHGGQGGYYTYATQSNVAPGNSSGNLANQVNYILDSNGFYSVTQQPQINYSQNYLTAAGSFTNSSSPYGTFDQNGSVWEILSYSDTNQPYAPLRGGGWTSLASLLHSGYSLGVAADAEAVNAGFRIVKPGATATATASTAWPQQRSQASSQSPAPAWIASNPSGQGTTAPGAMVPVTHRNNSADPLTGFGAIDHDYMIGSTNISIEQYTRFLNAVARRDPNGLYNPAMATDLNIAGISRSGSSGSYRYSVISNGGDSGNRPITYISWFDAARYANWMSNGQRIGPQTTRSTEDGAYNLNVAAEALKRAPGRNRINPNTWKQPLFYIPTEDEWYKAAYYNPTLNNNAGGYNLYATQSNTAPSNQPSTGGSNEANLANNFIFYTTQSTLYDPLTNYLTDVGNFSNSNSFYQTLDQSGLVYEWNDLQAETGTMRGLRGGYWFSASQSAVATTFSLATPDRESSDTGFRLAGVLTPTRAGGAFNAPPDV